VVLASSRWSPLSRLTQRRRVFKERSIRAAHSALRRPAVRVPVLPLRASTTDRPSVVSLITVCTLHAVLITTQSLADVAEAALATTIDTLMTAAADTVDAMTMVPVAQDTMIAATEVAAAAMTTVLVVSIAMPRGGGGGYYDRPPPPAAGAYDAPPPREAYGGGRSYEGDYDRSYR
jgi:hypothetical protein